MKNIKIFAINSKLKFFTSEMSYISKSWTMETYQQARIRGLLFHSDRDRPEQPNEKIGQTGSRLNSIETRLTPQVDSHQTHHTTQTIHDHDHDHDHVTTHGLSGSRHFD